MLLGIISRIGKLKRQGLGKVLPRLSEGKVREVLCGFRVRQRLYDGWTMVRMFMAQVSARASCRETIEEAIQQGWVAVQTSVGTGAYCNARKSLPERPLRELAMGLGQELEDSGGQGWCGRRVRVVDGSSVQLPDTKDNQEHYPQPKAQEPGCGFPVMCFVVLMSLATGGIVAAITGRNGKERSMFRSLWRYLKEGDVVLGDRGFGSYAELSELQRCGVDGVFRLGSQRKHLKRVRSLGRGQWLVQWARPQVAPNWIALAQLPPLLELRLIRFSSQQRGFRSRHITLITTLLDCRAYPKKELIALYRRRWEMELRLRDIKTTMGLEELSCKSARGCRKELWIGLLLYNLIRAVMVQAAAGAGVAVNRISFAGAVQRLRQMSRGQLIRNDPLQAWALLLDHLVQDALPHRPDRVEPRRLKRRAKNYRLLNRPRQQEKLSLLAS
jgi:hypothetical protein